METGGDIAEKTCVLMVLDLMAFAVKQRGEKMINLSIHLPSVLIGIIIGYIFIATVFFKINFDNRWDEGFSTGWQSGKKFAESSAKEKEEIEK